MNKNSELEVKMLKESLPQDLKFNIPDEFIRGCKKLEGKFIVFEGIDGGGKSTILKALKYISMHMFNIGVYVHREPGGSAFSEDIRKLIMENEISDEVTALLMIASRRYNMDNYLGRLIKSKSVLTISDRFDYSTLVYNTFIGNKSESTVDNLIMANMLSYPDESYNPDLIIVLDVDPKVSMNRVIKENKFDRGSSEYYSGLRDTYRAIADADENAVVLDANLPLQDVLDNVVQTIYDKLIKE